MLDPIIDRMNRDIAELRAERDMLRNRATNSDAMTEVVVNQLRAENSRLKSEIADLRTRLNLIPSYATENSELRESLLRLDGQVKIAQSRVSDLAIENDYLKAELAELRKHPMICNACEKCFRAAALEDFAKEIANPWPRCANFARERAGKVRKGEA